MNTFLCMLALVGLIALVDCIVIPADGNATTVDHALLCIQDFLPRAEPSRNAFALFPAMQEFQISIFIAGRATFSGDDPANPALAAGFGRNSLLLANIREGKTWPDKWVDAPAIRRMQMPVPCRESGSGLRQG